MTQQRPINTTTRRAALRAGLDIAAVALTGSIALPAAAQTRPVTKVLDFTTGADVAKAEAEGEFVFYTHDGEPAAAGIVEAFNKDFPKIKGKYFRAQNGALYTKLLAERSAGRFDVDVIQFSDPATGGDLQKRGGYTRYVSPQAGAYAPEDLSTPAGYYFSIAVDFAGIAYNTKHVKPADAPKTWKDLLSSKWQNAMSVKQAASGMQFVEWYELRKLYGDSFWKDFSKVRPRGFDSRAQVFDRLGQGDDKICALGEYPGYLLEKQKGSPIAFVAPSDGLVAAPMHAGIVDKAPHPEAARLFLDWLMSIRGQTHYQNNKYLYYGSVRKDAPPMPDGKRLRDYKLLIPRDMVDFQASRDAFLKEWNTMLGL